MKINEGDIFTMMMGTAQLMNKQEFDVDVKGKVMKELFKRFEILG